MALAHHADESVAEQRLDPDFRPAFAEDADLQVHVAFTQGANVLVGLGREPKPHAGRLRPQAGEESGSHRFDEAVVGADRERPLDRGGIENVVAGLKDRKGLLGDLADLDTQRFGGLRQGRPANGLLKGMAPSLPANRLQPPGQRAGIRTSTFAPAWSPSAPGKRRRRPFAAAMTVTSEESWSFIGRTRRTPSGPVVRMARI